MLNAGSNAEFRIHFFVEIRNFFFILLYVSTNRGREWDRTSSRHSRGCKRTTGGLTGGNIRGGRIWEIWSDTLWSFEQFYRGRWGVCIRDEEVGDILRRCDLL